MRKQGVASCGKHFPGYSCAKSDAHFELPKIDRTREELNQNELAVFKKFIDRVNSMMICHGWYPSLEPEKKPARLSRRVINNILRKEYGFDGLIITNDINMGEILNRSGL